jgi:hypothetical protein
MGMHAQVGKPLELVRASEAAWVAVLPSCAAHATSLWRHESFSLNLAIVG